MATNQGNVDGCLDQGDVAAEADRISGLPDDLLHGILIHLPCSAEAARTSVLSRRWRPVWARLPELCFRYNTQPASSAKAHDRVDVALAACSAPTVRRLEITMPYGSPGVPTDRVAPWLHFASQRLTGELRLLLPYNRAKAEEEVVLPLCERPTTITIELNRILRLELPPTGAFTALATLRIENTCMVRHELEGVVSTRCPRLKELVLEWVTLRDEDHVLSIRSESLQRFESGIDMGFDGRIEVAAPELQVFYPRILCDFYVSSPKFSEVIWYINFYDPNLHSFAEAGRHLRRLETLMNTSATALMRRFNIIDELDLIVNIAKGVEEYKKFLEEMNELAKCDVLVVRFLTIKHAFKPTMLHLIKNCVGIRKLVVQLNCTKDDFR